jgi:DNA polymerase-3 subunit delta'
MSDFDQMQYQAKTVLELTHIIQTDKIPNALLFSGNENTGKRQAARLFAKGCNCLKRTGIACNDCRSCRKIDADAHPDILTVCLGPDKRLISISQIREMGMRLASRPNEAEFRMVLILTADLMNIQAQNALLKLLEEPPEKTFFILTASKTSKLLPTIISRCRTIRFKPLTDTLIAQILVNEFKVAPEAAHTASKTADCDLKKAMTFLNLDEAGRRIDWINRRKYCISALAGMIKAEVPDCLSKALILSQKLSRDPDLVDDTMSILKTFFRDLMIFTLHPEKIVNLDFFDAFADINKKYPHKMTSSHLFFEWLEDLYEMEKRLAANSGLRLALDRFFLKIVTCKGTHD